jgi:predicted nucleic acid-binding protein
MPAVRVFLDSNTLLYARDQDAGPKEAQIDHWLAAVTIEDCGRANLQVLNEVTHVMLRKRKGASAEAIFEEVDALRFLGTSPLTESIVALGRKIRLATSYQWWDCLLLASALELGCTHFLSEDLQDGQRIEAGGKALTIVSPFAHTPDQILSS